MHQFKTLSTKFIINSKCLSQSPEPTGQVKSKCQSQNLKSTEQNK